MTPIETERLTIRNFSKNDWKALQTIIVQFESSEYAAYDHQWPTSDDEIKGIVDWFAGGDGYLAVCLRDTNEVVGFVALNPTEKPGEFNIGYYLSSEHHHKGYATESCKAVIDYAFSDLNAARILTGTAAANIPSCKLLRKLGMKQIGEETTSFRTTSDGKPIEFVGALFELTRDEWASR